MGRIRFFLRAAAAKIAEMGGAEYASGSVGQMSRNAERMIGCKESGLRGALIGWKHSDGGWFRLA
jgi:hypothetical protein